MNIKEAANIERISGDALRKKCRANVGKTIVLKNMGSVKISKKAGKYCIVYAKKSAQEKSYRQKQNEKMNQRNATERDIGKIPEVVNPERRRQCCENLALFLKTYMPETFYLPWSNDHLKVIDKLQTSVLKGGLFALAMSRSSGKSSLVESSALWATLYGHRRYVVIVGASQTAADLMLESIKTEIDSNDALLEDFSRNNLSVSKAGRRITQSQGADLPRGTDIFRMDF